MEVRSENQLRERLKKAMQWLAGIFAQHVVLQVASSFPLAYLFGLIQTRATGAPVVFESIAPATYPILAGLLACVLFKPAFVDPYLQRLKHKKREMEAAKAKLKEALRRYAKEIEEASDDLDVLNGFLGTGQRLTLEREAEKKIDKLLPILNFFRGRLEAPGPINVKSSASRLQWLACLRDERIRAAEGIAFGRNLQEINAVIEIPTFVEDHDIDDIPF